MVYFSDTKIYCTRYKKKYCTHLRLVQFFFYTYSSCNIFFYHSVDMNTAISLVNSHLIYFRITHSNAVGVV